MAARSLTPRTRAILAGGLTALGGLWLLALQTEANKSMRERAIGIVSQFSAAPHSPEIMVVDIDEAATAASGNWPWPRNQQARLIASVAASAPRAIALDIVLSGKCGLSDPGNADLADAIAKVPTVIGFVLPGRDTELPSISPVAVKPPLDIPFLWRSDGAELPCPEFVASAAGLATVSISGDASATVSTVPAVVLAGRMAYPGLAVDGLRLWAGASAVILSGGSAPEIAVAEMSAKLDSAGELRLHASRPGQWASHTLSASEIGVLGDPRLKDKLVFIGSSLAQAGNLRPTAADPLTPSSQIQAAIASQFMSGHVPWRPSAAIWIEMVGLAFGALLTILASLRLKPMASAAVAAGSSLVAAGIAALAYHMADVALDPITPALGIAAAGLASGLSQYSASRRSEASIRKSFEQRLPASVVAKLAAGPGGARIAGEERIVTALFTDIEGFTTMTSALAPKDLVHLLDGYFEGVTRIVTEHGGMVDKIVGDAAHAFFNMPLELARHEARALDCAVAIDRFTEAYRKQPEAAKAGFGRTRIGVETGPVLAGDVGAAGKYDYSAHGAAVNLAARLQEANKATGTTILAGPGIKAAKPDGWELVSIATIDLRGIGPTEVFEPRRFGNP